MQKFHGTFRSSSRLCNIHYYIYTPELPKAVIMLSHGMCEYIERYTEFAHFLCDSDIALIGCDHLGHGNSIENDDMLGYFGHSRGHIHMAQDLHRMKMITEQRFPDIPHFLIGHSMGSFIARIYFARYPGDQWNGAVFMGTAGPVPWLDALRAHLIAMVKLQGEMWRYDWGMDLALGIFNMRTKNYRTPSDWLSRDDKNVDKFRADPKCNFAFTVAGYRDLISALMLCNRRRVLEDTRTDVPVLLLSGGMDPIGEYGHGVRKVRRMFELIGCDVTLRIYREARHELLFELNRDEVMSDILEFIINRV